MRAEASAPRRASRERAAGRLGNGKAGAGLCPRGPALGRQIPPPAALRLKRGLGRALRRPGKRRRRRQAESWAWRREGRGGSTALRAGGLRRLPLTVRSQCLQASSEPHCRSARPMPAAPSAGARGAAAAVRRERPRKAAGLAARAGSRDAARRA